MNGQFVQSALRELHVLLRSPRLWATFLAVVLIFWVTGPYGTAERLAAAPRFGFWLVLHTGAWACALVCVVIADALLERRMENRLARMMVGAVAAAPLIALVTQGLGAATFGNPITGASYTAAVFTGLVLSVLFCALTWLSMGKELSPADASPAGAPETPFLRRLNPSIRAAPLHLAVQDHYVEVTTSRGRELVLIRFSDALDELGTIPGMQVHRSHWVSDAAVKTVERDDGRLTIILSTGARVPVSRPYVAAVRARWL
ncbi:LytTR family DNA-binding domain-containing protein [Aliihoeflea sp. PC F10.4]